MRWSLASSSRAPCSLCWSLNFASQSRSSWLKKRNNCMRMAAVIHNALTAITHVTIEDKKWKAVSEMECQTDLFFFDSSLLVKERLALFGGLNHRISCLLTVYYNKTNDWHLVGRQSPQATMAASLSCERVNILLRTFLNNFRCRALRKIEGGADREPCVEHNTQVRNWSWREGGGGGG